MKSLCLIAGLLQSSAAIIMGLLIFNINVMALLTDGNLVYLVKPLQAVFGLAGLVGLYTMFSCSDCCK